MEFFDEKLVEKYLAGDEKSLESLIKKYLTPIYRFIFRYIGDTDDAQDITQEVFIKMWRNIRRFRVKDGNFKAWLFAIAKNASIDFLKKKKVLPFSRFENEKGENWLTQTITDLSPLPSEIFERLDIAKVLNSVIQKLSIKYREVLLLRYNDNFTFREIAETLEKPLDTVKSQHRRAIVILRKSVADSF